jgi:hypothetical protein
MYIMVYVQTTILTVLGSKAPQNNLGRFDPWNIK